MFRPTTGELLGGIRAGLEQSVLPEVTSGNALRQLRAALHILRRLEKSWDRLPGYLVAENRDIEITLNEIFTRLAENPDSQTGTFSTLRERLHNLRPEARADGLFSDSAAAELAETNLLLQELLIEVDAALRTDTGLPQNLRETFLGALADLYLRMTERELGAWGTTDDKQG